MGWRIVVGGLADSAGLRSVHSQRCAAANAPDRMLWMPRIVLGFIGWQTCGRHPAAGSRGQGRAACGSGGGSLLGFSGHDRGPALPDDDQAVRGECLQGVPDDTGADALQGDQLGNRRQLVAGARNPDRMASVSVQ